METSMSMEEVINKISELIQQEGDPPRKKQVKKSNPEHEKCIELFSKLGRCNRT